ncbi:hypothetical protein V7968_35205 [Nocardia vulneris]
MSRNSAAACRAARVIRGRAAAPGWCSGSGWVDRHGASAGSALAAQGLGV